MTLKRLQELVPPPKTPTFIPTPTDWRNCQAELGVNLPDELLHFCEIYGFGTFRGTQMTALSIHCPGYPEFVGGIRDECQRYSDCRGAIKSIDCPFDVFPDEGGLLPLGGDENDVWLCWATKGTPNSWPIVVRWDPGLDRIRTIEMTLCEFLVNLFERRLELPCFPLPSFVDDVRFIPYDAGKTIGDNEFVPPALNSTVDVVNCGEVVGWLTDLSPDKYHLDGSFTPAETVAGARFVQAASAIDLERAYEDFTHGLRTQLRDSPEEEGTMFVVMLLDEGRLFGRRTFEPASIRWVIEHVPE